MTRWEMPLFQMLSAQRRKQERHAYDIVANEIKNDDRLEGLWLKAMSDAQFDQDLAKTIYVRLRVEALLDQWADNAHKSKPKNTPNPTQEEPNASPNNSSRSEESTDLFLRTVSGLSWLVGGVLLFQIIDWFFLGEPFTANPISFLYRIFLDISIIGFNWLHSILFFFQVASLCYFSWKGLKALRKSKADKPKSGLPATQNAPKES